MVFGPVSPNSYNSLSQKQMAPSFENNSSASKVNNLVNLKYMKKLGKGGKCKVLYVPKDVYILVGKYDLEVQEVMDWHKQFADKVLYVPKELKKNKEKELRAEYITMKAIENELNGEAENLAISGEAYTDTNGNFFILNPKANGDLEDYLNGECNFDQTISYIRQFMNGVREAHSTGHALGDIKPDNCLLYDGGVLKVSDFGKTIKVDDNWDWYTGNPRYMPLEGTLSLKGDVFSAGVCIIRMLDALVPDEVGDVYTVNANNRNYPDLETNPLYLKDGQCKFKGIEKALIQYPDSPHCPIGSKRSFWNRGKALLLSSDKKDSVEFFIHEYINRLSLHLKDVNGDESKQGQQKINAMALLLKQMTSSDPDDRPNMETVYTQFSNLFPE